MTMTIPRHPRVRLGNQWSDGLFCSQIDFFGAVMVYHPGLGEVLISIKAIDMPPDVFCLEFSFEFIHHILNLDHSEEVCEQFEFCEELIAVHLFGPKILEEFGWYEEGKEMITFEGR